MNGDLHSTTCGLSARQMAFNLTVQSGNNRGKVKSDCAHAQISCKPLGNQCTSPLGWPRFFGSAGQSAMHEEEEFTFAVNRQNWHNVEHYCQPTAFPLPMINLRHLEIPAKLVTFVDRLTLHRPMCCETSKFTTNDSLCNLHNRLCWFWKTC